MIKTQFSQISACGYHEVSVQNHLEAGLNLSDAYASAVLSLSGEIGGGYAEIVGGEIRYGGRISFNVVYGDEAPERLESGAEFSFRRPSEFESGEAAVRYELGEITLKQSGGMLYAVAVINARIFIKVPAERDYLKDIDCLKKSCEFEVYESFEAAGALELEDEFECQKISRVLESTATPVLTAAHSEEGAIICDGEVILTLVMLPFNQNNDILKETRVIPFRYELDADLVHEGMSVFADAETKSLSLKVYVDEETGSSRVGSAISLSVRGVAEGASTQTAVADAYSNERELKVEVGEIELRKRCDFYTKAEKAEGKFNCNVPESSRFLGLLGVGSETVAVDAAEGFAELLVSADAVFVDGENKTVARRAELPARVAVPVGGFTDLSVKITGVSARLRSGKVECEITFRVSCSPFEAHAARVVVKVEEGEEKPINDSAISVYLAEAGDTEWDVSRELGVPVDALYEINPEMSFPLRGGERIICFRRK